MTHLSRVAARMYLPLGENFTKDTGGLSSSVEYLQMYALFIMPIYALKSLSSYLRCCTFSVFYQFLVG